MKCDGKTSKEALVINRNDVCVNSKQNSHFYLSHILFFYSHISFFNDINDTACIL